MDHLTAQMTAPEDLADAKWMYDMATTGENTADYYARRAARLRRLARIF